jgi:hypothetical protein
MSTENLINRVESVEENVVCISQKLDKALNAISDLTQIIKQQQRQHSHYQYSQPPQSPLSGKSLSDTSSFRRGSNEKSSSSSNPHTYSKPNEKPSLSFDHKFSKPKLKSNTSLASKHFDNIEKKDSEREIYNETGNLTGWIKLYCEKRKAHFFFNKLTTKVIWESERLEAKTKSGDNWEKISYLDHRGLIQYIYLDPQNGEIDSIEPVNKDEVVPKFDPGDYDPSKLPSVDQSGNKNSTSSSKKRNRKSIVETIALVKHHHRKPETSKTEKLRKPYRFMFDPHDSRRMAWDFVFILPCLLYLTVMMPFRFCFMAEAHGPILILETTMDMVFILDIFINFRTGYFVPLTGHIEYDFNKVALKYLKSWFVLDVVSGIPFALFENVEELNNLSALKLFKIGRVAKAVKLISFLKVTKLLKTTKLLSSGHEEAIERVEDVMTDITTRSVISMLKIFAVISLVVHFMACLWVLIGRIGDINGKDNWLVNDVYTSDGEGFTHRDTVRGPKVKTIYISAYYYCYTTITSVGYGDIHPYNDTERIYCVLLEALGGFMYAIIIAALTSIATSTDMNKRAVRERLDMVASYVNSKQFPDHLGRRIRRYFRHFFESKTAIDEQRILTDLPTGLRHEVSTYLISDLMSNVTLFKDLGPVSWSRILPLLRPCRFEAGDLICSQGDDCSESFIILEGECRGVTVVDPAVTNATLEAIGKLKNDLTTPRNIASRASPLKMNSKNFSFPKITEDEPNAISALNKFAQKENAHFRILKLGSMINVLSLINVWEKSLETVVCTEEAECYTINSFEFRTIFNKNDDTFKTMREQTVLTAFAMYQVSPEDSHRDGGFEFGVPLYMYSEAEIEFRTQAYQSWKKAKKEHFAHALRKHESDKAMALALKRARAVNSFARAFQSVGSKSLKILPEVLKAAQEENSNSDSNLQENNYEEQQSNSGSPLLNRRVVSDSDEQKQKENDLAQSKSSLLQAQQELNHHSNHRNANSSPPPSSTSPYYPRQRLSPIAVERDSITSFEQSPISTTIMLSDDQQQQQQQEKPRDESVSRSNDFTKSYETLNSFADHGGKGTNMNLSSFEEMKTEHEINNDDNDDENQILFEKSNLRDRGNRLEISEVNSETIMSERAFTETSL